MKRVVTILGYLEGLSFLILLGYAMPMKYLFDDPAPVSLLAQCMVFCSVAYVGALRPRCWKALEPDSIYSRLYCRSSPSRSIPV